LESREIPVLHRSRSPLRIVCLLGGFSGILGATLHSQTSSPVVEDGRRVFRTNKQIVVLDVVVTAKNGHPVQGLREADFRVSENGHPQTVTSFEEHTTAQPLEEKLPELPPGVFTNTLPIKPGDSVTVLVLDSLNTPLDDQNNVRMQMLNYLKKPHPGRRTAIFALGTQLVLLQGFTDDPALLLAALNNQKDGAGAQVSPLLRSTIETAATRDTVAGLRQHAPDAAANMQEFAAEENSTRDSVRIKRTLDALQELAQYLGGLPGRKNVAWFSGAFPVLLQPSVARAPNEESAPPSRGTQSAGARQVDPPTLADEFGAERDNQEEIRKTDALLASAQLAIYPIAAEGLSADTVYDAGADARLIPRRQLSRPQGPAQLRNANHAAMDVIAGETGGVAIYGSNSLADALDRVASHGSHFYTLTYTTNLPSDGRFRKLHVELAKPAYQLAYRSGYYADDLKSAETAAATTASDPLSRFLQPGLPESTQIPFTVRVVSARAPDKAAAASIIGKQPAGNPGQGGDNPNLSGALTRYAVDFMIPARSLQFATAQDGHRHVSLEVALMVYDAKGGALNWMLRQINLNLDATRYAAAQATGVNFFLQIDSPDQGTRLRSGVYDLNAGLAGTLEIPLSAVVTSASLARSR
jgi:VWFA-related protein